MWEGGGGRELVEKAREMMFRQNGLHAYRFGKHVKEVVDTASGAGADRRTLDLQSITQICLI